MSNEVDSDIVRGDDTTQSLPPAWTTTPPDRLTSSPGRTNAYTDLFGNLIESIYIDRFQLMERVGVGGMGKVFTAHDNRLDRTVAIKLVHAGRASSRKANERLLREAQTLARLSHPNVVPVYEAGIHKGRVFIVMEYVDGVTLGTWLERHEARDDRARQTSVLRLFIAAGHGLAAAHKAGLVHRDFKPDNVVVGDDGRPRVVDFGLARLFETGASPARSASRRSHAATDPAGQRRARVRYTCTATVTGSHPGHAAARILTTRSAIMGTPAYMAPEQMAGEVPDSRSDQFSFCVALFEALYGKHPYGVDTLPVRQADKLRMLQRALERGARVAPPRDANVPSAIRKALERGLSLDRADRFADMDMLLSALEHGRRQRQRRWYGTLAAFAFALVFAIGGVCMSSTRPVEDACVSAGGDLDTLWTPTRRQDIARAFERTGLDYAATSWRTAEQRIERYALDYRGARVQACEAVTAHSGLSPAQYRRQTACLDRGRQMLAPLVDRLVNADRHIVQRAVKLVDALPDLSSCHATGAGYDRLQPPRLDQAAGVEDIRRRLAFARTYELLGAYDDARRVADAQQTAADAIAYAPVRAEAYQQVARLLMYDADTYRRGESLMRDAIDIGVATHHDDLVATAWYDLALSAARHHANTSRGNQWIQSASERLPTSMRTPRHNAIIHRIRGLLRHREGNYAQAERHFRQALNELVNIARPPVRLHAHILAGLGETLRQLGRGDDAWIAFEDASALLADHLGAQHPHVANMLFNLVNLQTDRGDLEGAERRLQHVLHIQQRSLGASHQLTGKTLLKQAEILFQQGKLDRARARAQACLDIYRRIYGDEHSALAPVYIQTGAIDYRRGDHRRALDAYDRAIANELRHKGDTHMDVGYARANRAEVLAALGAHRRAIDEISAAAVILAPDMGDRSVATAFVDSVRGRALLGAGLYPQALDALTRSADAFDHVGGDPMPVERADASWALAQARDALCMRADESTRRRVQDALQVYEIRPLVHAPRASLQSWLKTTRQHRVIGCP